MTMLFEVNHLYHIFNRGNNSQQLFYSRENYLYFLSKLKTAITPYADTLAWCLMPNHFQLLIYLNQTTAEISATDRVTWSHPVSRLPTKTRDINQSVAIALRSYTRALQQERQFTGSLFQQSTKAICLSEISGVSPAWFQTTFGAQINVAIPEKEYPQTCFDYIHNNPVQAGLCGHPGDWEFSSYRDYTGQRNGTLVNQQQATALGLSISI